MIRYTVPSVYYILTKTVPRIDGIGIYFLIEIIILFFTKNQQHESRSYRTLRIAAGI